MRSSLQHSCYVDIPSVEGGATSTLNPLALTYLFGQASTTPDRKRDSKITKHPPHLPVSSQVVNKEGAEISEASFQDGSAHSRKQEGDAETMEGTPKPSRREGRGSADYKQILKSPKTRRSPGVFFSVKTTAGGKMRIKRKNPAGTGASQRVSVQQVWGPDAPFQ